MLASQNRLPSIDLVLLQNIESIIELPIPIVQMGKDPWHDFSCTSGHGYLYV